MQLVGWIFMCYVCKYIQRHSCSDIFRQNIRLECFWVSQYVRFRAVVYKHQYCVHFVLYMYNSKTKTSQYRNHIHVYFPQDVIYVKHFRVYMHIVAYRRTFNKSINASCIEILSNIVFWVDPKIVDRHWTDDQTKK